MKFPNSLIQPMTISQHTRLRTLLCLAALAAMLFAGTAWGQMRTNLVDSESIGVPIDSTTVYPAEDAFSALIPGDASDLDTTPNDGNIDRNYADLDGNGPNTVGIVDWVVVELRTVVNDEAPPTNIFGEKQADVRASKTALLLSNGFVVDANKLADGFNAEEDMVQFEDLTFEPGDNDLYVVVTHRNHVSVMSAGAIDTGDIDPPDGFYTYDFTTSAAQVHGGGLYDHTGGRFGLYLGDVNGDGVVQASDLDPIRALGGQAIYDRADVNFDTQVQASDSGAVRNNAGQSPAIGF